jgi:hypothetical protein
MNKILALCLVSVGLAVSAAWQMQPANAAEAALSPVEAVDAYTRAWGVADETARHALLEKAWADDGRYCDPSGEAVGRDALVAHIGGFLKNPAMKGFALERVSGVDVHHNVLRFDWVLKNAEGNVVMEGVDYGVIAEDGRLQSITGFFGPIPEKE